MSLKRNAFYNIVLNVSNVLFPFITTPYISRVLGVENIGVVNFAVAYAAYFVIFAMLGVQTYGMRLIATHRDSSNEIRTKLLVELFTIITISSIIVSAVYIASIYMIDQLYENRDYLLVAGATIYLASLNVEWYFAGRENFKFITFRSISIKILMIVGMFVFVRTRDNLMSYLLLSIAAMLFNHIWNWIYLLRNDLKNSCWKGLCFRCHVKPLFVFFVTTLSISIYTMLDTLMLGFMSSYSEVGYYTSAIKITRLVIPVVTAMSAVVFVRISTLKQQSDYEQIRNILLRSFMYMYTFAVPITIGLIVIAPRFVPLFFGSEFMSTVLPMQVLSLLVLIIGINNIYGPQIVQAMGYDKKFLTVILVGTVVNFTLNMLLIRPYGAVGASLASVVAEAIVTILMIISANKIIKIKPKIKSLLTPILASLPIILLAVLLNFLLLNDIQFLVLLIFVSGGIYLLLMLFCFKNEVLESTIKSVVSRCQRK